MSVRTFRPGDVAHSRGQRFTCLEVVDYWTKEDRCIPLLRLGSSCTDCGRPFEIKVSRSKLAKGEVTRRCTLHRDHGPIHRRPERTAEERKAALKSLVAMAMLDEALKEAKKARVLAASAERRAVSKDAVQAKKDAAAAVRKARAAHKTLATVTDRYGIPPEPSPWRMASISAKATALTAGALALELTADARALRLERAAEIRAERQIRLLL